MSTSPKKVLIVLTSHAQINDEVESGWFLSEFAHGYNYFKRQGVSMVIASPNGGEAPLSKKSVEMCPDEESQAFAKESSHLWMNTEKLSDILPRAADEFDAVYYPGGYGPMFDLYSDETSLALLTKLAAKEKVISGVCHGPAAFINAKLPDGTPLLAGCTVNAFPMRDESIAGKPEVLPFRLETEMRKVAKDFIMSDEPLGECVAVDRGGKLVMGQNPASVLSTCKNVMKGMGVEVAA